MNIIKITHHRTETVTAKEREIHCLSAMVEKRIMVSQIMTNKADVNPDYEAKILTAVLHCLSASRLNNAVAKLAETPNNSEPSFPSADLTLISKICTFSICKRQGDLKLEN